ncbi:MAG: response regulator [Chloroflexi bacterium]|nr:response regulator [Chloroflexota bacterium]
MEREGFQVAWKEKGEEGIHYAVEQSSHLILLDVRLPDGSGFDFCRRMRTHGLRRSILILRIQSEESDKVLGLEMGATDYVTKPYSLRELVSWLGTWLRRVYGEPSNAGADIL